MGQPTTFPACSLCIWSITWHYEHQLENYRTVCVLALGCGLKTWNRKMKCRLSQNNKPHALSSPSDRWQRARSHAGMPSQRRGRSAQILSQALICAIQPLTTAWRHTDMRSQRHGHTQPWFACQSQLVALFMYTTSFGTKITIYVKFQHQWC